MQQIRPSERINPHKILLVAAAESPEGLPPTVRRCFSHEVKMGTLTEDQRSQLLSQSLQHASKLLRDVCYPTYFILYLQIHTAK